MPPSDEAARRPLAAAALIGAMLAAGIGLTLFIFYPGVMTFDARFVYEDIAKGSYGDWQSPVMTVLWGLIDPIAPGPGSMFLLVLALYWFGFGLLAFRVARHSLVLAAVLLLLALSPPALFFQGIIWRDVLFADTWLVAAALAFVTARAPILVRVPAQAIALALIAFGVLLRPNALIAAPLLAAAIIWPAQFRWKRTALLYVPAGLALFALMQFVYYSALDAKRQHPMQSVMVFDLGGISHFAKQNQFPVTWTAAETMLITLECYQPTQWDLYWRFEPCDFVMKRLEDDGLFGTPVITRAWLRAVATHPVAYLTHRISFMWNFLARPNLTIWIDDVYDTDKKVFEDRPAFQTMVAVHNALIATPLFRAGTWLLGCIAVTYLAWRRRETPSGVFAIGVCGSGAVYVLTYFAAGVASDFRYAYWAVLASLTGAVVLAAERAARPSIPA